MASPAFGFMAALLYLNIFCILNFEKKSTERFFSGFSKKIIFPYKPFLGNLKVPFPPATPGVEY